MVTEMTPKQHLQQTIKLSGLSRRKWYHTVYLYSPHWRELREAKFLQVGRKCKVCGTDRNLQCHHLKYRAIFNVTVEDLEVLCQKCHTGEHKRLKKARKARRTERQEKKALKLSQELDSAFNRIPI